MSTERKHCKLRMRELVLLATQTLVTAGCLDTHHAAPIQANQCTACHGDANRVVAADAGVLQAAPPFDLNGDSDSKFRGVGAHQNHLAESASHAPVACNECHTVPDLNDIFAPGHLDNPNGAKITFGPRAQSKSSNPTYDPTSATCSNTYCHQSIVPTNNPIWQAPRDSTAACGSCHGLPPAVPHPQSKDCFKCHGSVIDQNRQFVNKKLHINGQVDTANLACNSCHGTDPNTGGPPPDLEGNTTSDHAGVGAHQNHLTAASATHDPVACKSCHVVPPDTRNHPPPDAGPPATITFDDLATHNNSKPVYDSSTHQCSNTYCHQFYSPSNNPIWQAPRDSTAACGSCHGLPPALPHPQNSNCSQCHAAVVDANRNFVNKSLHINGHIDTGTACNSCHGTDPNGGPPPDLEGNTTSDHTGVGAHQNHLTPSATHDPVACNSCHVVPTDTSNHPSPDAGPPATITFGGLSTNNNSTPVYNSSTHQCSNTYCHQFYSPSNNPIWQAPRDSTVACGSCHALPPPFVANTPISAQSHPKVNKATDCYRCHGMVVDSNLSFIASQLHVNGTIDYQLTCSSCHGSTASFAPPTDLAGNTAVTSLGVGAHQKHLTGGLVSRPVPCYECHVVPTNVNDPGHIDDWGTAEVTFSGAAIKGGHLPIWNRQTASCTDSWCHGPVTAGNVSPMWIDPSVTITCTSCHGFPPPDPHPQVAQNPLVVQCFACHTNVTQSYGFVDRNLHVNGIVDF